MADTSASEPAPAATQQQQQVATEAVHADTEQTAKTETAEVKHGARKGGKKESKEDGDASKPAHFEDSDGLFKLVCRTFMKHKCKRSPCKNVHDPRLCPEYWKSGECKYGVECRRNHFVTLPTAQDAGDASADAKPAKAKKEKKAKKPSEAASAAQAAVDEYGDSTTDSKKKSKKPKKKNTEVWDPMTKPVDLRITYDLGSKNDTFTTPLATRDVVLVPNLFSDYKTGELYTKLVTELEGCGIPRDNLLKMWHGNDKIDGTHLIVDDRSSWKKKCPTFDLVTDRIKKFFKLSIQATRFNWYLDTSQWKPFHFDAAAVKPEIAAKQNFTVAISFGATRDAAFEHAQSKTTVSMPQPDGCAYAFARDTNVIWRHGILQDVPVRKEGRISVIAWGWVDGMEETEAVIPTAPVLDQKTNGTKGETKKSETGGAAERKPKKKKDKNAPKRAASAFFIFSKSMRETVKSEKPELEFPQVSAEIKDRWNALSEEERKVCCEDGLSSLTPPGRLT